MVSHQKRKTVNKTVVVRQATKPRSKPMKRKASERAKQYQKKARAMPAFGPVSTIDSAPVSIGNTVQGCSPVITPTADGVRVRGRDFLNTANATAASVTGWCLVGGSPISPECMSASVLKGYCNSYAEYQVHGVALHFITSSTTADAGSLLIYVGKDRAGPGLNPTAANLLPFVLSDHCTVITPVWKNASAVYHPAPKWYTTGIGNDEPLSEQACGEMFVLSKVTETNSPGYILMDYDITFRNMQVNIKSLTFPLTRMKYTEVAMGFHGNMTAHTTLNIFTLIADNLLDGTTLSSAPSGFTRGDVYKVIITTTNAVYAAGNPTNMFDYLLSTGTYINIPVTDGLTLYGVAITTGSLEMYANYASAIANTNPTVFNLGSGGNEDVVLHAFISLVGAVEGALLQSNY